MTRRTTLFVVGVGLLGLALLLVWLLIAPTHNEDAWGPFLNPGAAGTALDGRGAAGGPVLPTTGSGGMAAPTLTPVPGEAPGVQPAVASARVIDRAGQPVVGATVAVHRMESQGIVRTRYALGLSTQTDAEGRVRISGLPAGTSLGLQVRSPDHAPTVHETFTVQAGATLELGDIVLDPGLPLTGRVTGTGGEPIEAAEVRVEELGFLDGGDPAPQAVLTDADGRYRVEHLGPRQYTLAASAIGYATDSTVLSLMLGGAPSGARQDFALLEADSPLSGVVLGPYDEPVADVQVSVNRRDVSRHTYFLADTRTGADGRFRFDALAAGTYQLDLRSSSHYLPKPVTLASGREDVVVRAQRALSVRGQLECDTQPPRRFEVRTLPDGPSGAMLLPERDPVQQITAADPPGSFVAGGLRPGTYRFEVKAPGWAVTSSADVIIGQDGADAELSIRLLRGATLRGRVEPPTPDLSAEVRGADYDPSLPVEALFPTPPVHSLVAPTAPDGGFVLEHVPPGDYTLTLRGGGQPPVHLRALHLEEDDVLDVGVVRLPRGGAVFGNVVGPDGRPRSGVRVTATSADHHQETLSGATGDFRMDSLPAGDFVVQAVPSNLWEALRLEARVQVALSAGAEVPVLLELKEREQPLR